MCACTHDYLSSATQASSAITPQAVQANCTKAVDTNLTTACPLANSDFRANVSGEWFGYEASFGVSNGAALQIEERYVPDEFRDWGVEVKGFEVVTSTRVQEISCSHASATVSEPAYELYVKRTRALPSVGCEADAVVPEVHVNRYRAFDNASVGDLTAPPVSTISLGFDDGGFVIGPSSYSPDIETMWHVCIADPQSEADVETPPRRRARLQFGHVNEARGCVSAFIEAYDGVFCDGDVLPGCGGKNAPFVDNPRLVPSSHLAGKWTCQITQYTLTRGGESKNSVPSHSDQSNSLSWSCRNFSAILNRSSADAHREICVAMPEGMTASVNKLKDGSVCVSAGWLTTPNLRAVISMEYDELGSLVCVKRSVESTLEHISASQ